MCAIIIDYDLNVEFCLLMYGRVVNEEYRECMLFHFSILSAASICFSKGFPRHISEFSSPHHRLVSS
jgi:hypothetical protein